jgi:hypothetical protein
MVKNNFLKLYTRKSSSLPEKEMSLQEDKKLLFIERKYLNGYLPLNSPNPIYKYCSSN